MQRSLVVSQEENESEIVQAVEWTLPTEWAWNVRSVVLLPPKR